MKTTRQHAAETVIIFAPIHASAMPATSASAPARGLSVALTMAGNVITDSMMAELSIVGGFLIAMSGLAIMKVKDFKALNFLPALIVPVVWCLIRG